MKQILQSLKTGETLVEEVPTPQSTSGALLIESSKTLISSGTERMLLDFGKAGLLGKVKRQPEKARAVLAKIKTDGFASTISAVKSKLDQPLALGYCNVGTVLEVGDNIVNFARGDRVVSNGPHAEIVRVPQNLCAKIPDNVSDNEAAFTVVGAIALQGIRLSKPTLGECYVVIGLGIIGLLTVQLLIANGCRVLGVDFDPVKLQMAKDFGAEVIEVSTTSSLIATANQFSRGRGVDAVLITAATDSNEPLHQAASICRKRGRIVLVGTIGSEFNRSDFYEKEISFQVSCSYGPGRYDDNYEQYGNDYPIAFVRWTEQRNFEAILDMMSNKAIDVIPLISHQYTVDESPLAYQTLQDDKKALGIVLDFSVRSGSAAPATNFVSFPDNVNKNTTGITIGLIGAGNYATRILGPILKSLNVSIASVTSDKGISSKLLAKKLGASQANTSDELIYEDDNINMVVIATRHDQHAKQVIKSLVSRKHVFVEKPLALDVPSLSEICEAYKQNPDTLLMVGFNRRFSPHIKMIKQLLSSEKSAKSFVMTINAGFIPREHWTQDLKIGGGRIIGEACHFIDLLRFLADSKISSWHVQSMKDSDNCMDTAVISLTFADGSVGVINYFANGHQKYPKEELKIFQSGRVLELDNYRKLKGYGWSKFKSHRLYKQDKGQHACMAAFVESINSGSSSPIPFDEIIEVSNVSIEIMNDLIASY